MTARPVFLQLAAFFFAFAAAVGLVGLLRHTQPARGVISCGIASARTFKLSEDLGAEVGLVTLDRTNSRSYTRLKLRRLRPAQAPDKLWVRTFFFSPDDKSGRVLGGDAVEISPAQTRTATAQSSSASSIRRTRSGDGRRATENRGEG